MPLLAALLLPLLLAQDRAKAPSEETLGKTHAQILAMGSERWVTLYTKRKGDSTPAIAGAFVTYGDALAMRNDRLLKGRKSPLRTHLRAFSDDLSVVGYSITGGGTIWTIFGAQSYRDVEEAFYRVLTHSGQAPRRVTSDVERAVATLAPMVAKVENPEDRKRAQASMVRARADLRAILVDARQLSRRDSDTVLEFCRDAALSTASQAGPE